MSAPKDWTGRCFAITKYIYNWRCQRFATGPDQLCNQHRRFGALVPEIWESQVNEHGVNVPRAIGTRRYVPPAAVSPQERGRGDAA